VTDEKSPLDQALDLVFYGPVGLAITAREELPKLVEKGRERVNSQVTMARVIGEFVVNQGQQEAAKVVKQVADTLIGLGIVPPGPSARPPATLPARTSTPSDDAMANAVSGNGKTVSDPVSPPASSDHLAIPGYDSLSASQVVQRLDGLSNDELEAVRAYESATRGRRTILSKIAQLQAKPA
jgi:hypothetical protein